MFGPTTNPAHPNVLLAAGAMAVACSLLSVFVILRRWALVGEGISHSGFGGAGTAWLAALVWPVMEQPFMPYAFAILFCLLAAVSIGWLSRRENVNTDAAIGIFLVASLAWGFLGQQVYVQTRHTQPPGWDTFLFGQLEHLTLRDAMASVFLCAAVLLVLVAMGKELLAYCYDPTLAETGGVRGSVVHYVLMILIAITMIIGMRITGSVLVPALLVLPGAAAVRLTRGLRPAFATSLVFGVVGTGLGLAAAAYWRSLPAGPSIVLALFAMFLVTLAIPRRA
ncbi:MAG TPA: metal ABC transporter permease [Tepidisphaeraceae bacterium]|jgi:ABC-type Mn2+/Zn2+ transport system permease subunit|nr:metal ABC transporter permease [Tepidisphaeraceae bacterium]